MTKAKPMAITVAVLFIIATGASVIAMLMTSPILARPDILLAVSANANTMILAVVCMFIAAIAVIGIPITLLPLFKRHSQVWAYWYFAIRFIETLTFVVAGIFFLTLVSLAQDYTGATNPDASLFNAIGAVILDTANAAFNAGTIIFFSISAVILGIIFHQTNLVPRWLSVWKLIGGVLALTQGLLVMFSASTPLFETILVLPIALNEMVLALWLIIKGFNSTAFDRLSAA